MSGTNLVVVPNPSLVPRGGPEPDIEGEKSERPMQVLKPKEAKVTFLLGFSVCGSSSNLAPRKPYPLWSVHDVRRDPLAPSPRFSRATNIYAEAPCALVKAVRLF